MLTALMFLLSAASIVCWIFVLVQIFKRSGVGLGILGIICGLFAFIYGWVKAKEWNIQKVMVIWTVLVVLNIPISYKWNMDNAQKMIDANPELRDSFEQARRAAEEAQRASDAAQ